MPTAPSPAPPGWPTRPSPAGGRDELQCHLVGGGIAGLASAVYLIRDGQIPGRNIHILEASRIGGSLDAAGSAEAGYSMRGSRMFGPAYVLTYELLDGIRSLDDPAKSVAEDTFEFWQSTPWYDKARLVENGQDRRPDGVGLAQQGPRRPRQADGAAGRRCWTRSASTSASSRHSSSRTSG